MDEINAATPISATSLAGFALLGAADRGYTAAEVEAILEPLLTYIDDRGLPGPDPSHCRGPGLLSTLGELTGAGVLTVFDRGPEQVWSIAPDNHAIAAYYRNGALHHFVDRAIVELGMFAVADGSAHLDSDSRPDPRGRGFAAVGPGEAMRLRDILKFEFFFPAKEEYLNRLAAELDLIAAEWRTVEPTQEWVEAKLRENAGKLFARRTLQTFFDAQFVVATHLISRAGETLDKKKVLTDCLGPGRQLALQGVIPSRDSVSTELYDAAYRLAENRGAVGDGPADEQLRLRRAWLAEVKDLRCRLARIAAIEAEHSSATIVDAQLAAVTTGESESMGENR